MRNVVQQTKEQTKWRMKGRMRRVVAAGLLAAAISTAVAGCGGGGAVLGVPLALLANLSGFQEVQAPAVNTNATGTSTVTVNAQRTSIQITVTTQGFTTAVVGAHIHAGALNENGGIIFDLMPVAGEAPGTLTRTLTAADFRPVPAQNINTFNDAVGAILRGRAYFNIHTNDFLGGEIRGQITLQ